METDTSKVSSYLEGVNEMKRQQIKVLTELFFAEDRNEELAYRTLEFYISDLKLFVDMSAIAKEIEAQQCWPLMPIFKLFDYSAGNKLEEWLMGIK